MAGRTPLIRSADMILVPEEMVTTAQKLADAAGAAVRRYYRAPIEVDIKPDSSPVTIADREAEKAMRALLAESRPFDGVIGEEFGSSRPNADWLWVLDPIDGTKSFIAGRPIFGTLIALLHKGAPVLGVIDQPVTGDRWIGVQGRPTLLNGLPASTRSCPTLDKATIATTAPDLFPARDLAVFELLRERARTALYGGDCYNYGLLASGYVDLVIESGLKLYDFAALAPVVTGAGGMMCDWSGKPLKLGSDGRVIAAGDPALLQSLLGAVASA